MNLKIKYRESFRPFAPSVLREHLGEWFELDVDSPYMLLVAPRARRASRGDDAGAGAAVRDREAERPALDAPGGDPRRLLGAHPDRARGDQSALPRAARALSTRSPGCPVLVNTSFNVRGEPIVCTPEDAYRCFMRTEMDHLVIGSFVLDKTKQPAFDDDRAWQSEFELD